MFHFLGRLVWPKWLPETITYVSIFIVAFEHSNSFRKSHTAIWSVAMNYWTLSTQAIANTLAGYLLVCLSSVHAQQTDIDGRWDIVRNESSGKPLGAGMVSGLTFCEGEIVGGIIPSRYTLRPDKSPKEIDSPNLAGGLTLGIYKIEGDTLTITESSEPNVRPDSFDSIGRRSMTVYHRSKTPLHPPIDPDTLLVKGRWRVVAFQNNLFRQISEVEFSGTTRFTNGIEAVLKRPTKIREKADGRLGSFWIALDSSVHPHRLEGRFDTEPLSSSNIECTVEGIYELKGDSLVLDLRLKQVNLKIGPEPPVVAWSLRLERIH